jgi:hypothetical protein
MPTRDFDLRARLEVSVDYYEYTGLPLKSTGELGGQSGEESRGYRGGPRNC